MNPVVSVLYFLTVSFIHACKWVELQILRPFTPQIAEFLKKYFGSIGVVLKTKEDKEWSEEDLKLAKLACKHYDKLVYLKMNDDASFVRLINTGVLGLGESFMDGQWSYCNHPEEISELGTRMMERNKLDLYYNWWNRTLEWLELHAFNLQTKERAFRVGEVHYDLGNDLYQLMLDPWMQYTCGYWKDVDNLNDAQVNKMDLVAKKLDLKPGMRVLDLGCGWGTLCKYLAENYQVECVGVTISKEGVAYGKEVCKGLPVDIRLQDYRELDETFDRVVTVGILEHVGFRNYPEFFKVVRRCLKDDGIALVHTIARNHTNFPFGGISWAHHYVFPNGYLPDPIQIAKATHGMFIIEDWHNFGPDYAKTLYAWRENFMAGWPTLKEKYGGERFYRMWIFYLSTSIALFRSRRCQLWQIVLSKDGLKREYRAAR